MGKEVSVLGSTYGGMAGKAAREEGSYVEVKERKAESLREACSDIRAAKGEC